MTKIEDTNYKYLFLFHKAISNGHRYWTMQGDYSNRSIDYRNNREERYKGTGCLEEITVIECNNEDDATDLQRAVNEIFKVWTALTSNMIIEIEMKPEIFISAVKCLNKYKYDNNKMIEIFDIVHNKYKHNIWYGQIYFIECDNNKLKIGETGDMSSRWNNLKLESQNKAKDIVSIVYSKDRLYDEARLHLLCRDYKTDGNKQRTKCKESKKLSELFKNCDEVRNIWNKYTETMKKVTKEYMQYILTGDWPEDN